MRRLRGHWSRDGRVTACSIVTCAVLGLVGSAPGCSGEEMAMGGAPLECATGFIACGGRCVEDLRPELSHIQDVIFSEGCLETAGSDCHGDTPPPEDLFLTSAQTSFDYLVNQPSNQRPTMLLVAPGSPEDSYLVNKLRGRDMEPFGTEGEAAEIMPNEGLPLCEAQIVAIEEWIRQGALNN